MPRLQMVSQSGRSASETPPPPFCLTPAPLPGLMTQRARRYAFNIPSSARCLVSELHHELLDCASPYTAELGDTSTTSQINMEVCALDA